MTEGTVDSRAPAQTAARVTATATAIIGLGVVTAATGVVVLVWPEATLQVIAVVFGIFAVADGVLRLVSALVADDRSGGWRMLLVLQGVLSVLVGIVFLRHPFQTLAVLTLLLGMFWVVGGLLQVVHGLGSPASSSWHTRRPPCSSSCGYWACSCSSAGPCSSDGGSSSCSGMNVMNERLFLRSRPRPTASIERTAQLRPDSRAVTTADRRLLTPLGRRPEHVPLTMLTDTWSSEATSRPVGRVEARRARPHVRGRVSDDRPGVGAPRPVRRAAAHSGQLVGPPPGRGSGGRRRRR
jgi:uncharacterized membrane protein HdeD (DUF308 family)